MNIRFGYNNVNTYVLHFTWWIIYESVKRPDFFYTGLATLLVSFLIFYAELEIILKRRTDFCPQSPRPKLQNVNCDITSKLFLRVALTLKDDVRRQKIIDFIHERISAFTFLCTFSHTHSVLCFSRAALLSLSFLEALNANFNPYIFLNNDMLQ